MSTDDRAARVARLLSYQVQAARLAEGLAAYGVHTVDCAATRVGGPCDCGLTALLEREGVAPSAVADLVAAAIDPAVIEALSWWVAVHGPLWPDAGAQLQRLLAAMRAAAADQG